MRGRDANEKTVAQVAEKIRRHVEAEAFSSSRGEIALTMSLGGAASDKNLSYERVLINADEALYQAKHKGRNCAVINDNNTLQLVC